jgi:hypothetical protein
MFTWNLYKSKEWQKCSADKLKGHTYSSKIAGPTGADGVATVQAGTSNDEKKKNDPIEKKRAFCKSCQNYGHSRRTSLQCRMNPKYKYDDTVNDGTYNVYCLATSRLSLSIHVRRAYQSVLTVCTYSTYREF